MKRRTALLSLAALGAFLVSFLIILPATVIGYFLPPSVSVGLFSGSVWNGGAEDIVVANRPMGTLDWTVRPLHLLRGRLALDAQLQAPEGFVTGWFSLGLGGNVDAQNVEARWPLSALPVGAIPPGWNGDLEAKLRQVTLRDGALQDVLGVFDANHVERGPPNAAAIGSYRLTFDENSRQADKQVGRLQDTDGPMQVGGTLTLGPKREFVLDGLVAPRANAPETLTNTLRFLGNPDANGQRPFSIAGTY